MMQRWQPSGSVWVCASLALLLLAWACKKEAAHSDYFMQIFKDQSQGTFRGIDIGFDFEKVKAEEKMQPKHEDQWGLVYENGLGGKNRYYVEYNCRDPKQPKVDAIVLNVLLEEKASTRELFSEMEGVLRNKFGVADGGSGNLLWRKEEANLMVSLRMLDDKKSISLNYGLLEN